MEKVAGFIRGVNVTGVYKQERYRQWVAKEPGVEDYLKYAYRIQKQKIMLIKNKFLTAISAF